MKILIIEDEKELSKSMVAYLQRENFTCDTAYTFADGRMKMEDHDYDCILLDISLPDGNGLQILKELKLDKKLDGVIIISAKDSLDDKLAGLNLGADDYLAKPFHLSELNARVGALIRRRNFQGNNMIFFNELAIDLLGKCVTVNKKNVDLTRKEYDLLLFLTANKNKVVSKNAISERISGEGAELMDNSDIIYAHIKNLKKKLMLAGCSDRIRSIYGMGYKFISQ